MEEDLVTRLVDGAIDGISADQISWNERRAGGALPALVLQRITVGAIYSQDGRDPLNRPRLQVKIIAASPADVDRIEADVCGILEPPATVGGTAFGAAFLNMAPDLPTETLSGGAHVFARALDFDLSFSPVP